MQNDAIRVLLVDNQSIVRRGCAAILNAETDIIVAAEAANAREALAAAREHKPHVAVMEVLMPGGGGIEATREITLELPLTRVLALSSLRDAAYVRAMLLAGARGYMLKDAPDKELLLAVRTVASGGGYLSPSVSASVLLDYKTHVTSPLDMLTRREREILQRLAEGRTNKEVAGELGLSIHTVDAHRGRLMDKLNLHNVGDLVRFSMRHGIIA